MTNNLSGRQGGFSLVELMIALVLGLMVVGSSLAVFTGQRVTTRLSADMADVQADGRVALDAISRDARAAGDFGCWPVANPIDGRMNAVAYDVKKGGIRGYSTGANGTLAKSDLIGSDIVRNASPEQSVVALTGIFGVLTTMSVDMANESALVSVARSAESFKDGDVAVVTDCINWAKFQVTSVVPDAQDPTRVNLAHAGGAMSVYGGGNKSGALGAAFKRDSTVGSLDTVWWFIGTIDGVRGLYRLSARSGSPVLVSTKVYALQFDYNVDADGNTVVDKKDLVVGDVKDVEWPAVRAMSAQLLMRSDKASNAGSKLEVENFAGVKIPNDRRLYLPLQVNVALRNQ
jgi:type IV pilus assembly protein PilW